MIVTGKPSADLYGSFFAQVSAQNRGANLGHRADYVFR